jgi:hypothetical protein
LIQYSVKSDSLYPLDRRDVAHHFPGNTLYLHEVLWMLQQLATAEHTSHTMLVQAGALEAVRVCMSRAAVSQEALV